MNVIQDGAGQGYAAKVNKEQRLSVTAKTESLQHLISQEYEEAYQCIGTVELAVGKVVALHIKNISTDQNMIITYIRHQLLDVAGGSTIPSRDNYFHIGLTRTYLSGGTLVVPVNSYSGSGNNAAVLVYEGSPVLEGTSKEVDRHYTKEVGDMYTFNKEGALIVPPNQTIELSYVGDQTSGLLYTRISFVMETRGL